MEMPAWDDDARSSSGSGDHQLALCCLHNVMRIRYPTVNNNLVDQEDDQHYLVPGEWRRDVQQLLPLNDVLPRGQYDLKAGSENRKYLTAYINSPDRQTDRQTDSWQCSLAGENGSLKTEDEE